MAASCPAHDCLIFSQDEASSDGRKKVASETIENGIREGQQWLLRVEFHLQTLYWHWNLVQTFLRQLAVIKTLVSS